MSHITIHYLDGEIEEFPETSRAGGSYHTSHEIKNGICIVKDAWGNTTGIPLNLIKKVESR